MAQAMAGNIGDQPIIILKEGSSQTKGRDAQRSNIQAAQIISEAVRSSLGPKGMDKMLVDGFGDVTITNDGAVILKEMDVQHPVGKMMVEISKTQDDEVGDGTTSVVVLAGELLNKAQALIEKDVHPTIIVDGYRKAADKALELVEAMSIKTESTDKDMLRKVAVISQAGKLLRENSDFIANLAVDAVSAIAEKTSKGYKVDIDDIKVEKKAGGSLEETRLIQGILLDKEVVHSGMPKRVENARIALLNAALEVEKTEFDAKINIERPDQMKAFLDEEERLLRSMVEKVSSVKANVLVCQKGIDDVAQHFLAKAGVLAIRRASEKDMDKLSKSTGGKVVTNIDDLSTSDLGSAALVEERKISDDKMTFVEGCKNPRSLSILVRGGTERVVDEAERSIHDALCVVRDVIRDPRVVAGGGAVEIELASQLKRWSEQFSGKEQLAIQVFAESLEVIPLTLAENAGLDPIDILVDLRARHQKGEKNSGVGVMEGHVEDMTKLNTYEPLSVKEQILKSSSEAACMILRIDDIIASAKSRDMGGPPKPPGMGEDGEGSEFG